MGTIFPVRKLDQFGVLTDPDPYDIPLQAWSFATNVRFRNGRVVKGPVFRSVEHLGSAAPRFVFGQTPTSGLDELFIGYMNGRVFRYASGSETDYSISGYTPNSVEATWTGCRLADVIYINRSDRDPWYITSSGSTFADLSLASGTAPWSNTWRAGILRSCGGALCAFNVTKGATNFPTMVKTSGIPTSGTVPATWDQTSPSSNATENILAEMEGEIIDAANFGNNIFIYGIRESWLMQPVGGQDIFDYFKVFDKHGAINANCVVEVEGKHFVFGPDDIWMHDGVTPRSICDERTREFIFSSLNAAFQNRCFAYYDPLLQTVNFCFVSGDAFSYFPAPPDGCNRQVVYDLSRGRWTFDDVPLVYFATQANMDNTLTYATVTSTYATIGGSYQTVGATYKKSTVMVGDTNATYNITASLYAFDPVGPLSQNVSPVDTNATKPAFLKRDGIDLDEIGVDLKGYKVAYSLYPQGRIDPQASQPIQFAVGGADYFNVGPNFSAFTTWDGQALYKLDFNIAGRYLAIEVEFTDYHFFSLSGYDVDIDVLGER